MSNAQKTPFVKSLTNFVEDTIGSAGDLPGKSVPASVVSVDPTNTIVTVKMEIESDYNLPQVTCPIACPEYIRLPIQPGMKGFVVQGDYYLGGMSGLGGGVADLTQQANLTNSVFVPLGNADLDPTDDPQSLVGYGPGGVILRDQGKRCVFHLTPNGIQITLNGVPYMTFSADGIALTYGGKSITISNSGIVIDGQNLTSVDGHNFLLHSHNDVTPGIATTGPVTP